MMNRKTTITFVLTLTLLMLIPTANATLSVETFTCDGQSGTVAVENGATFSCSASIKNEDTQNSATLSSVRLLVNGNWAEQTSYTGTGFGSSISAGASTTATFSGLKAVTPGATNKFQSIQLDSSSDTTVTNTNVNVITIKSLSVSASSSSAATGSEFDISATVIAGGDMGSATLAWSGSGGCTLASGHSASKSLGSLSHNTEATRTWRITQGSSDCVNTVAASGTSSSVMATSSKSTTVTATGSSSSSSSSSSSGGGGGGGAGGASKTETKTIASLAPGIASEVAFTKSAVTSVTIETAAAAHNVSVSVDEVSLSGVALPEGHVYKYLEIKVTNLNNSNIKSARIAFSVNKTWLADKDRNSVRLLKYANGWQELATSIADENATHARFTAATPGFSTFAITAQAAQGPQKQPEQEAPKEEQPRQEGVPVQVPGLGEISIPKPVADYGPIIIGVVIIIVIVLGWFHYHGPGRKMKKVEYHFKPPKK